MSTDAAPDIEVFVHAGCPHCEAAKAFLDTLRREQPDLRIKFHDIVEAPDERQRLAMLVHNRVMSVIGVPTFLIGADLIVGFHSHDTTGSDIRTLLARKTRVTPQVPLGDSIEILWFGQLHVKGFSLPLFTVMIGLLD